VTAALAVDLAPELSMSDILGHFNTCFISAICTTGPDAHRTAAYLVAALQPILPSLLKSILEVDLVTELSMSDILGQF
jgi:hypothetical protein